MNEGAAPIVVRRSHRPVWDDGKVTYAWWCRLCGVRAYHRTDRFSDKYRARYGKPPDRHPRERAIEGGLRHLHRKHTPCTCCAVGSHSRFMNPQADS